jgi:cell division protein FtsQ
MQARGRERSGHFWWRAAEPIPTRPEPLAAFHDAADHADSAAPNAPEHGYGVRARGAPAQISSRSAIATAPRAANLGALRPAEGGLQPRQRVPVPLPDAIIAHQDDVAARSTMHPALRHSNGRRIALRPLRRRHAILAAGLVGALLYAAATGFGRHVRHVESLTKEIDQLLVTAGLGINEISLSGHRHTLDQDIFRALGAGQQTMLSLDVRSARQRIEALPWIEAAAIVRVFPDKLKIELRERIPAAVWLDGGRTALVDADGRVLSYVASFVPPELPRIAGPGAPEAAAELRAALQRFPTVASRLQLARRIGQRRWDLVLTDNSTIRLAAGPSVDSLDRLMRLERDPRSPDYRGQVVDLTVPRSIAVSLPALSARPL